MNKLLVNQAFEFLSQYGNEKGHSEDTMMNRQLTVKEEIESTGTYIHTFDEISYGAKLAWRNSTKCIGRLFWETLDVFDARDVESKEEVAQHIHHHIQHATNEGKIRSTITIFPPLKFNEQQKVQIWSHQLIRYAGYLEESGEILGDPASLELTKVAQKLGWQGDRTPYDFLPVIYQWNEGPPSIIPILKEEVLEIKIDHPINKNWGPLNLKWYAVPIIADRVLEIGGLRYPAPFNGWYMETEIAARNFVDSYRYNRLRDVAKQLELDTSSTTTFWRDRALVELQHAVYASFKQAGVQIVDHYTAAQQFQTFREKEDKLQREVKGDWTWLVPPVSPSLTPIFHQGIVNEELSPNFIKQKRPLLLKKISEMTESSRSSGCPFHV
ncbi:nitric oxide synthase oxygenase [Paenisporosarcina antarctica]|uniref:Nitric oxide synthase oxygenase n=1 Tax=Paenisporosarcina antarctica TaxID=417367 RepID=A0A4P6ZWB1_9BACL|nr:nitric oxide synthase oxygenase [Paenisporosarcina antarctica]QBP40348.1 nitric oxide synthase oxygenase [Paenisporosarcina antarctica]